MMLVARCWYRFGHLLLCLARCCIICLPKRLLALYLTLPLCWVLLLLIPLTLPALLVPLWAISFVLLSSWEICEVGLIIRVAIVVMMWSLWILILHTLSAAAIWMRGLRARGALIVLRLRTVYVLSTARELLLTIVAIPLSALLMAVCICLTLVCTWICRARGGKRGWKLMIMLWVGLPVLLIAVIAALVRVRVLASTS